MEDDLGIVYHIDNAQQFWSELEDIVILPSAPTLSLLDSTLRRFLFLCAKYHEKYLQSPLQLEHACELILESELFAFHSERMCEIIMDDIQSIMHPRIQLISYHVLLCFGQRRSEFFRSHKRWYPLLPLLIDHVLVNIEPDVEVTYSGMGSNPGSSAATSVTDPVPIEAKLRSLGVRLLYEICRVQKFSVHDLQIFGDSFIDYLFELVEQTGDIETFNYSVIRLIVSLNEQFMVASLGPDAAALESQENSTDIPEPKNRVLRVLMRRMGSCMTFGSNMIFMLNRAQHTPDDLCMQLLILKILYVLFTTRGTSEFFYTNDLTVLVDVFIRELVDLDEDSESLRHTYLRVLHPLLTKTQLQNIPYKRPQIVYALESLVGNPDIRDINPTTKRLVERCLSGDWCVQFRKAPKEINYGTRRGSPNSEISAAQGHTHLGVSSVSASGQLERSGSGKSRALKSSKSVEHMVKHPEPQRQAPRTLLDGARRTSNASTLSLHGIAAATTSKPGLFVPPPKRKGTASSEIVDGTFSTRHHSTSAQHDLEVDFHHHHHQLLAPNSSSSAPTSPSLYGYPDPGSVQGHIPPRRPAPPAPPKRRKPPAIPVKTNGGATITTIRTSATSPLANAAKTSVPPQGVLR